MRQVHDHAGIEPRFGQPEQEAHREKLQDQRAAGRAQRSDDLPVTCRDSQPRLELASGSKRAASPPTVSSASQVTPGTR